MLIFMGGMLYTIVTICLPISPMKIDLSKFLVTATGKPVVEVKRTDNGKVVKDENGDPVIQYVSMWSVVDAQITQYTGGEGTKIRAIGDALLKAYRKGIEEIEIEADLVIFLREKVINSAKMSDLFKEQIKEHLLAEEKAHVKPLVKRNKKQETEVGKWMDQNEPAPETDSKEDQGSEEIN